MTRAAADLADSGASHSPPSVAHSPDARAQASLKSLILISDRIQETGSIVPMCDRDCSMDRSVPLEQVAPPVAQGIAARRC